MALRAIIVGNSLWAGAFITLVPYMVISSLGQGSTPWYLVLLMVLLAVLGLLILVMATGVYRQNNKQLRSHLLAHLDEQKPTGTADYVLYLRSFLVDHALSRQDQVGGAHFLTSLASHFGYRDPLHLEDTWEGRIARLFWRFGRVVAVGRPGEPLPPIGAGRFYLPADSQGWKEPADSQGWKEEVSKAIRGARLVVIVAAVGQNSSSAEGTLWEYTEAVRLLPPSRVVLVVLGGRDAYECFRARAALYFGKRTEELHEAGDVLPPPPALPDWPEPQRPWKLRKGFPLHGVVCFDADWAAECVHFDATAARGPTPYARWRRTVRTQVDPWMDKCEQRLPGNAVYPVKVRFHWHLRALAALLVGWLGIRFAQRWDGLLLLQKFALFIPLTFILVTLGQLAAGARSVSRRSVEVRLPDPDEDRDGKEVGGPLSSSETPSSSAETQYLMTETMKRWPGRFGLGLFVIREHYDEDRRGINPPDRPIWRVCTTRTVLTPFATVHRRPGGIVFRGRELKIVQTEWDADMTSRQFGERALIRFAGVVSIVVGTAIGVFRVRMGGQMLGMTALSLLLAYWFWVRYRKDRNRCGRLLLRPRIPADLTREPCVLYLRPHPDDPHPPSPWQGPLDLDLHTIFSKMALFRMALFRVGYVPHASPPPIDLARLPLPADDWQTGLTMALPHCELVVIPATGTASGTLWQLTEAVRLLPPSRLLLLLLSGEGADEKYARFRRAAAEAFAERGASLPKADRADFRPPCLPLELPDPAPPGRAPALRGAIHFAEDWTPAVLRFSPLDTPSVEVPRRTQLQRIRTELQPILADLSSRAQFHSPRLERRRHQHLSH
jgi:hypothetical protein